MNAIDRDAQIIWNYMQMHMSLRKCDVIIGLGGLDTRPAERAAQLFLDGYGDWLVFSGGLGSLTSGAFAKPEAEIMTEIALRLGVPEDKIIKETQSSNTGENAEFTFQLLKQKNIKAGSILLVVKNYFERRAYATFKKFWPDKTAKIIVTSPQISYEDYFTQDLPKDLVINVMVGDLQRIREYPKLGFQIEQTIPVEVLAAYERLVKAGFNKRLIK